MTDYLTEAEKKTKERNEEIDERHSRNLRNERKKLDEENQ